VTNASQRGTLVGDGSALLKFSAQSRLI
jgi:hypothetical protein